MRDPLAAQIVEELLSGEDCPAHVREPRFAAAVQAWGRQQAIVELLVQFIARLVADGGLEAALSERVEGSEETSFGKGRGSKRTRLQRLESAVSALDRAERRCQSLRADLLLTPASARRAGLDTEPKFDSALFAAQVLADDARKAAEGGADG